MNTTNKFSKMKLYLVLHLFLIASSTVGIISKFAGRHDLFSLPFFLFYCAELIVLVFYAVGWQQFIKRMPLSTAYMNRAVTIIWGCVWGVFFFHEQLSTGKILGCFLVLAGVVLYGYAGERKDQTSGEVYK